LPEGRELLTTIDACKPLFSIPDSGYSSLYLEYLHCLAALLDEPEPDAPAFMSRDAWQIKSCQTVLGGWAQLRHTWALQTKETVGWANGPSPRPGFVEPVPEFFARMARLCEKTEAVLRHADAFEVRLDRDVAIIRDAVRLLESKGAAKKGYLALRCLSKKEQELLSWVPGVVWSLGVEGDWDKAPAEFYAEAIEKLKKLADDLEKGKLAKYRLFRELMNLQYADIAPLWGKLTALCYRLEALAHKQLRKAPFNVDESRFLKEYGVQLAAVMLHAGNAYISPKDDAPRVADVFSDPLNRRYLEIGIGRAQALDVHYPDNDLEILCRGTELPYYEF